MPEKPFTCEQIMSYQVETPACIAEVAGAGRTRERTMRAYAEQLARHERSHHRQIETTITALYDKRDSTVLSERQLS